MKYLLFSLVLSFPLHANQVIADFGGESAVRFYVRIQPVHTDDAPQHPYAVPSQLTEEQLLPVISHRLSVGKVSNKTLDLPGAIPLFLIGADTISMQWLRQHYEQLVDIGAVGLVVNVATLAEMQQLRSIVPALTLMPAPADDFAEQFNLHHYPVLITAEGISQ